MVLPLRPRVWPLSSIRHQLPTFCIPGSAHTSPKLQMFYEHERQSWKGGGQCFHPPLEMNEALSHLI